MRIDTENLKALCRERRLSLSQLLADAKVSKTAYYALARKPSVLPGTIRRLAQRLDVAPTRFLSDPDAAVRRIRQLQRETEDILRRHPDCDRDVVLRTLMNLDLPPLKRLQKGLIRGRKPALHR